MTWTRLDADFPEHPKILAVGWRAELLFIHGLLYANRHLTDGFIPYKALPLLLHDPHRIAVQRLIEIGLWMKVEKGYQIHDFLEYQPSRDEIKTLRETRALSGRLGGLAKARAFAKQNPSKVSSKEDSKTLAVPSLPVPVRSKSTLEANALSPEVPKKRPNGTPVVELSPEHVHIAEVLEDLLGHQLSALDLQACDVWLTEFRYLDAESIIDRMRSHVLWCVDTNRHKPKTAAGFHETLRVENDHRADSGATPTRSGQSSGFTKVGDLLH